MAQTSVTRVTLKARCARGTPHPGGGSSALLGITGRDLGAPTAEHLAHRIALILGDLVLREASGDLDRGAELRHRRRAPRALTEVAFEPSPVGLAHRALDEVGDDLDAPSFDADRFLGSGAWAGHWSTLPADWAGAPETRLTSSETLDAVRRAIDNLPPMQAQVIRLRDVLGWTSEEVRNALDLTETNQRVLLHRARAKVRAALEREMEVEASS